MSKNHQPLVPPRDKVFNLRDYDPNHAHMKREEAEAEMVQLRLRLNELQELLYADKRFALLVVLQATDTGGKDGTIKSVFEEVGPLGCSVVSFGVPSEEEKAHDYLWRIHKQAPERGHVTVFNRSHYECVLVERIHSYAAPARWKGRYDEINRFEEMLTAEGTAIMKFFLHISKDEQRERLQARVDNPKKNWKFREGDMEERKYWDQYQDAYQDMIRKCNTKAAPWHVVPANRKWYRDVVVAKALIKKLESLDLRYPPPEPGVAGTVVQ